jgi:hypothetical protein
MRDLFDAPDPPFDGDTATPADVPRLARQLGDVKRVMAPGEWWTPEGLELATGYRWASISARIRDLRKAKHGGHTVERKRAEGGLFVYRLLLAGAAPAVR